MLEFILIASVFSEWLIYASKKIWKYKKLAVILPIILIASATGGILAQEYAWWHLLMALLAVFRIFNLLRVAEGRMHNMYLLHVSRRSGLLLGLLQLMLVAIIEFYTWSSAEMVLYLAMVQLAFAALVFVSVTRNVIKTRHVKVAENYPDKELPAVTVAIPARNETPDLENCLRSIIANDYPKLEILVLDDCSHDKTPEIIKKFAQDGVRFIQGTEPQKRWLAKNQAYQKLANEATGKLILFCGVDVRFGPEAIRALVTTMLSRKKQMMSVMPRRLNSDVMSAIIQPMRYWWELVPPRRYFNRPSVLSTCWLIDRKVLKDLGGFEAVSHNILPEGYFAREVIKNDGYSFLRADDYLDVQTRKSLQAQRMTAIRMRYPQLRRRMELVMGMVLGELIFLLGPFLMAATGIWLGFGAVHMLALISCLLLIMSHVLIVQISSPANVLVAVINFPIVVIVEMYLGLTSMYRYEFSEVIWKGRNICEPVMHVHPSLPAVSK